MGSATNGCAPSPAACSGDAVVRPFRRRLPLLVKLFFDTSVLVAAMVAAHPQHAPAAAALARVIGAGRDKGSVCCHSLAELYAVLTRLPLSPAIHPAEAHRLIEENVITHFRLVPLVAEDYRESLRALSGAGWAGALIYDALLLPLAQRSGAEQVFTFNIAHFQRLAHTPELRARLASPLTACG